jgi:hypothetical protein
VQWVDLFGQKHVTHRQHAFGRGALVVQAAVQEQHDAPALPGRRSLGNDLLEEALHILLGCPVVTLVGEQPVVSDIHHIGADL